MSAGSSLGALFDGIQGTLGKKLEEKHQEEQARKKELRDFYLKGILNADTDEQAKHAADEYTKLSGPEAKKGFQKIVPLLQRIRGVRSQQQGPVTSAGPVGPPQQSSQPMDEKLPSGTPAIQAASPRARFEKGPDVTGVFSTSGQKADIEEDRKMRYATQEYDFWKKKGYEVLGKDANPRDIAEYAGSKGTKLPPLTKPISEKAIARPGEDPSTGKPYEGLWDHHTDPSGEETWAKRPDVVKGSGSIRSVPHSVSLEDAKAQATTGRVFKDTDDKEIDLDQLPPDMGLQAMEIGDKLRWIPITPNQTSLSVGNHTYITTPYNKSKVGQPGGPPDVGLQRTGSTNTPTQVVTGTDGVPHVLGSTTTPNSPGARPSGAPAPAPAKRPGGAVSTPSAPAPAPAPSGGPRGIQGVPIGMYNQERNRAIPVREAATQIFGDPSQPDIKGLKDYMSLADNPQSRERLGKALRLTFDGLNQATSGGHVSAEAGPISVSTGGIGSILQNYFGVPAKLAEQQTEIMSKAIGDLTPEEREAYDSVMSSFSTVVGLRSLTKASAAQASVSAIERELPVIGVNTFDSRQFADQLQRLAEVVSNGTKGMPAGMIDPALVKRINNLPSEMQKLKQAKPAKAPESKGKASTSVVDDLLRDYGGAKK